MNRKSENLRQRKSELRDNKKDVSLPGKSARKRKKLSVSNATSTTFHRIWTRTVVIFCVMVVVYYFSTKGKEKRLASVQERNLVRFQNLTCSPAYIKDISRFPKCAPSFCGRLVNDRLVNPREVEILLDIAKNGIKLAGSSGGASILDLHSGALSKGKEFVDIYNMPEALKIFKEEHLLVYKNIKSKIKKSIAEQFMVDIESLHLTYPSFFSRITNLTAKTVHDEYWHPHIDKDTYEAFHFTALLYLTDYGKDFTGGRFFFMDSKVNMTIEPVRGRVSIFTSGAENVHFVEKVQSGIRYALTVSFTCDQKFSISDPKLNVRNEKIAIMKADVESGNKKNST